MSARLRIAILIAGAGLAPVAAGCQSTQATSEEREAEGQDLLGKEKKLVVNETSNDIEVIDSTLITDEDGTAVVVELENSSEEAFANVPILIDVRDAKGKTVFKNDTPGLEPALTQIPLIEPGEKFEWVNNLILPTAPPDSVKVKVGVSDERVPAAIPEIEVGPAELKNDPVSGVEAVGDAENASDVLQEDLTFFGVARKGDEIVAAGRAVLKRLQPDAAKAGTYHIFFVGDPEGADITVTAPPSVLE